MDGFNIGESLEKVFDEIVGVLPEILAALAIYIIGYFVAKTLKKITTAALRKARLNEYIQSSDFSKMISRAVPNPARLAGKIVFWAVMLGVISLSVTALGSEVLNDLVTSIYGYLPNVLAAVLIFLVAAAVSGGIVKFVHQVMEDTHTGKIVAAVAPSIVMSIATFMILVQLEIATEIVTITYTAIIGAVALGLALAFGLGGKDVAGKILNNAYQEGQTKYPQIKAEVSQAKKTSKRKVKKQVKKAKN